LPEESLEIGNDSFIEISKPVIGKYISKKTKVRLLESTFTNTISNAVGDAFSLYDLEHKPLDVY